MLVRLSGASFCWEKNGFNVPCHATFRRAKPTKQLTDDLISLYYNLDNVHSAAGVLRMSRTDSKIPMQVQLVHACPSNT